MEKRRPQKKNYKKPYPKKKSLLTDLEVAKKMINIHQSAMDRKLEFDLSFESVRSILSEEKCYYTGRTFDDDGIYSRSIDRVDSSKGYIEGNVVACTVDFNGKKSNLSIDEIKILYEKLVKPALLKKESHTETPHTGREENFSEMNLGEPGSEAETIPESDDKDKMSN